MKFLKLFLLLVGGVLITNCCSCRRNSGKPSKPLTDIQWTLIQQDGRLVKADGNYHITFNSADSTFNGRGDCNTLFGRYALPGAGLISIDALGSTRMFCPDQQMEDRFFQVLDTINRYEIDGNLLMLYTDDEVIAIMEAK